jgi:hypothetical protein
LVPISSVEKFEKTSIEAVSNEFWLEREKVAPTRESVKRRLAHQAAYLKAVQEQGFPPGVGKS